MCSIATYGPGLPTVNGFWSRCGSAYLGAMQHLETQTVIVGAGIVGMATALDLARAGHRVHVLDRAPAPAAESSGAAAGMLAPQHESEGPGPFLDLCLQARDLWVETAADLAASSGIDPEHRTDGFLHLALDEEEWAAFQRRMAWQQEAGLPVEPLSASETVRRFPMVSRDIAGALYYAGDHHLHTDRAVEAYAGACRVAGVTFLWEEEVRDFLMRQGPKGTRLAGVPPGDHTDDRPGTQKGGQSPPIADFSDTGA